MSTILKRIHHYRYFIKDLSYLIELYTIPVIQTQEVKQLAKSAADKIRVITLDNPLIIKMLSENLMLSLNFSEDEYLPAVFPNRRWDGTR